VVSLREALVEAEEAMGVATADAHGVNPDWVIAAISRYSGEVREAQAQVEALELALARADGLQGQEQILNLAQEVRTPMTAIAGYADLLLMENAGIITKKQRDFLKKIQSNLERMTTLFTEIVKTASPKGALVALSGEQCRRILQAAVAAVTEEAQQKGVQLRVNLAGELPALLMTRDDFYWIVFQLLHNAVLASIDKGEVTLDVDVDKLENAGNEDNTNFLRLIISDSGVGIPSGQRSQIFALRLDPDAPAIVGLGDTSVGLATTHTLVTEHEGRIWVESEMGRGSRFTVLLPVSSTNEQP
jgi:signal transduction histidine kinase